MRKTFLLPAVLTLFLLVPASITWAQTISSQKGLTTAVFETPNGQIKVYLPDDIRPGEMISGIVVAEPSGSNDRQTEKNLAALLRYQVALDGIKFPVRTSPAALKWQVPENRITAAPLELQDAAGKTISTLECPVTSTNPSIPDPVSLPGISPGCSIPSHALTAAPLRITGSFDGDLSTTQCNLTGQPLQVLAESPRQCQLMFPENAKGPGTMQVNENGQPSCSSPISGVDMHVTTGKLNLRKGESTYIDVKVTGLQNLPDKAVLTITNITPQVVTMTNGNIQVIPIWPPADSAGGTFSVHCPAVSNTTGNFMVNINLDLPQPGATLTASEDCPPGYKRLSCQCEANVKVTKSGNKLTTTAKPACKGQYGVGISTFPVCSVSSVTFSWSVQSGAENVDLVGKKDGPEITIRPKNKKGFSVCVTMTVTCIDGTICKSTDCYTEQGEEPPPPPPVTTTRSRCSCSASCTITVGAKAGGEISYSANVTAACTGTFGTGSTRSVCAAGPITYSWKIGASGKDAAEITGKSDGKDVKVKLKSGGSYTIFLSGTLTCNDGTTCDFSCNVEVPYIPETGEKVCLPNIIEKADPKMTGGLKASQTGVTKTTAIFRDEFIALEATGSDVDLVILRCDPQQPCPDTRSEKTVAVNGKVRFAWTITGGEGRFVKLGCGSETERADIGEHVIFQPPVVPLPKKNTDTTLLTTIELQVIDDGSPVIDPTVTKIITIKTTRKRPVPDKYEVAISGGAADKPTAPATPAVSGTCQLSGPSWIPADDLVKPVITLPGVADADKMVLGQWIVLRSQDQADPDVLTFNCTSTNCIGGPARRSYPDNISWEWTIVSGGGELILGKNGQYVIYEAPLDMPKGKNMIEVKIKVKVMNPAGPRKDPDKESDIFTLKIYQPGIKLSHPDLTWLPEDSNSLELKSELMYKDGNWLPALAHMCRIHFFELVNVSEEKGVCLNVPVSASADQCRDLQMKNEAGHEAFDDSKGAGKCTTKEIFQQARTQAPVKDYTMKVYSRDFGAYGFLRSFGNVNKKTSLDGKPVYISIPVLKTDVRHPANRPKKTEYADNRVTIPHDIDENRIADGGWTAFGNVTIPDPADNKADTDGDPAGDAFAGDGLTTYEEYRGFKVAAREGKEHRRTNTGVKDIFIRNENNLPVGLYETISDLDVHQITEAQYNGDDKRVVNFNFNAATHLSVDQKGLHLIDKGNHSSLLGIAYSPTGHPTIPNFEQQIRIYTGKVRAVVERVNKGVDPANQITYAGKLAAVVAHELLHGNNVCHHGEGSEEVERSHDLINGLRSGNIDCVMRYDNTGTALSKVPEKPGTILCTSAAGTGYNANGQRFGNAATNRGNCKGQIRVSGAAGMPKSCGNR